MHIGKFPSNNQFVSDRRGTSAVEFALIVPVFLLILFGLVAYGVYFGAANSVQQLAADAARASIAGLDEDERRKLAASYISDNASGYMLLDGSHVSVDVTSGERSRSQFDVSISYDAERLPIWNMHIPLPLPGKVIRRSSTIRIGGI